LYKYGVVVAFVGLLAIIVAVIRKFRWSLLLVVVAVILVLYLVDPVSGNWYLSFTSGWIPEASDLTPVEQLDFPYGESGLDNLLSASIIDAVRRLNPQTRDECPLFYDFFKYDQLARDTVRWENPEIENFGFCSGTWIATLLVLAALLILLALLLLLLAIFSLAKKMGLKVPPAIELQAVPEPDLPVAVPYCPPCVMPAPLQVECVPMTMMAAPCAPTIYEQPAYLAAPPPFLAPTVALPIAASPFGAGAMMPFDSSFSSPIFAQQDFGACMHGLPVGGCNVCAQPLF
jgi:hypothetical protein